MSENLHIVCPQCDAVNRIPQCDAVNRIPKSRIQNAPKCGKCHQPLFSAQPVELNTTNFNKHIARNDIPVLVDFWAPWCGPCKMMAPAYTQAAQSLEPSMRLVKVNTEDEQALGAQYGIRSIPTLAVFKKGQEIARQAGAMSASDIVSWAQAHI